MELPLFTETAGSFTLEETELGSTVHFHFFVKPGTFTKPLLTGVCSRPPDTRLERERESGLFWKFKFWDKFTSGTFKMFIHGS